jgi:hypothetical protein
MAPAAWIQDSAGKQLRLFRRTGDEPKPKAALGV